MSLKNTPRILHIASGDLWAGAEAQLFTLVKTLHQVMRVPVEVVLLNPGTLEEKLKLAGVRVTILDESRLNGFRIIYRLYRVIKSYQPDVVHTHRTKENILGSLAALFSGNSITVRTVHGANEYTYPWWNIPGNAIQFLDILTGRFLQKRIIAVSDELAGILAIHYPAGKIRVIRNGIDSKEMPVRTRDFTCEPFRIGLAGRLVPVKRVDIFLDTALYMKLHHTDLNLEFRIFGDGPLRGILEQQCRDRELQGLVSFYGHVNDISAELQKVDALVMTSDHEGLPMVLLEAMALGTNVIAHDVGGIPDLLDNGNCGVLVHEHSTSGYADAIATLASNPLRCAALSANAKKRVERMYSAEENAGNYLAEYKALHV